MHRENSQLYNMIGNSLSLVEETNFDRERTLQALIESNLERLFSCQFVATEYSTIAHGRFDTLALSAYGNPVIIEYKKSSHSGVHRQVLSYINWIETNSKPFEKLVRDKLGDLVEVNLTRTRVICIAPSWERRDIQAAEAATSSHSTIELWQYRLFAHNLLLLKPVSLSAVNEDEHRRREVQRAQSVAESQHHPYEHINASEKARDLVTSVLDERIQCLDTTERVRNLIQRVLSEGNRATNEANLHLALHGIKVSDEDTILFAKNHDLWKKLLPENDVRRKFFASLERLSGVQSTKSARRFGNLRVRCYEIPAKSLLP